MNFAFFVQILYNINFSFLEKEQLFIGKFTNKSDKTIYIKNVFSYYRYDYFEDLNQTFVSLVVKPRINLLNFSEDLERPHTSGHGFSNAIILDRFSSIYYDKASSLNHFNGPLLHFDNKKEIIKKCVPIPLKPGDTFKFLIPTDPRVWQAKSFEFPASFEKGKDSLLLYIAVDLPISHVKSQKSKHYKSLILRSDTIWFKPH